MRRSALTVALLVMLLMASTVASAHDGTHNFRPDQIAPIWGMTELWIDFQLFGYTKDPARIVGSYFYWGSTQDWTAYLPSNAYQGLYPSGLEVDVVFRGWDKIGGGASKFRYCVWSEGAYSEKQNSGTWYSDVPYAYIDVSVADDPNEPTIGIGSGYWQLARAGYLYYAGTLLREPYWAEADDVKVRVARTHHHSTGCSGAFNDPWCKYEDSPSFEAVASWEGNAPGDNYWRYPSAFDFPYVAPSHDYEWCDGGTCTNDPYSGM